MRLLKQIAICLLIVCTIPAVTIAQVQKPTLIIMQFFGDASTDPAIIKQINEIFESNIISTNYFSIKDRQLVLDWLKQQGEIPETLSSEAILALARSCKADFIIAGTLTRTATNVYTVNPRVVAADTGREVYARPITFSADVMLQSLEDLAAKIVVAVRQRTDVTLSQIDALVQIKDWQAAQQYLEVYERIHPDEVQKTQVYRAAIYKALGEKAFTDAKRALALNLFESARSSIGLALKYEPDNVTYKEFSNIIEQQYALMRQQTEDDIFKKLDELRIREQWDAGLSLINYLESSGSTNPKIALYKEEFTNKREARLYYIEAQTAYLAGDFSKAVFNIERALKLYPDNDTYQKFREKVVALAERDAESRAQWSKYMEEARSFSTTERFLLYRPNSANVFIVLDFPAVTIMPAQDVSIPVDSEGAIGLKPQFGVGAWYQGKFIPEYPVMSFISVSAGWYSGITTGYALAEQAEEAYYSGSYYTLYQMGMFYFDAFGGVEASVTAFSFLLSLGLELAPSIYSVWYQKTIPYINTSDSQNVSAASFNGGYRFLLAWNLSEKSQLFVILSERAPLHSITENLFVGFKKLSISAGYSFRVGK